MMIANIGLLLAVNLGVPTGCDPAVMGEGYWKKWSPEVQAEIEADIERYRKADGETAFDVAAAVGAKLAADENGVDKPAVRLAFDVDAGKDEIANVYWQNDYFGRIFVNGKLAHDALNGPEPGKKWGVRPVRLKEGKNEIAFETRHGMSGSWKCALYLER